MLRHRERIGKASRTEARNHAGRVASIFRRPGCTHIGDPQRGEIWSHLIYFPVTNPGDRSSGISASALGFFHASYAGQTRALAAADRLTLQNVVAMIELRGGAVW